MSVDLAAQKAVAARLSATSAVTSLCPATNILDRNERPNPNPSIIIGEGQTLPHGDVARKAWTVFLDLHIWKKEIGTSGVKAIAGAVVAALQSSRLSMDAGYSCGDCYVPSRRFLRDPSGDLAHAVVTVELLISET